MTNAFPAHTDILRQLTFVTAPSPAPIIRGTPVYVTGKGIGIAAHAPLTNWSSDDPIINVTMRKAYPVCMLAAWVRPLTAAECTMVDAADAAEGWQPKYMAAYIATH